MPIKTFIKDQEIVDFFLVKEINIKDASNGKYLDLLLIDNSGSIKGKYWKCNIEEVKNIKRGSIVKIKGKIEEYKGLAQLNIFKIRISLNNDNVSKEDFIKKPPFQYEAMYKQLTDSIESISNKNIKNIVLTRVKEVKEKLLYFPAAKTMHHVFLGGLLHHTNTMVLIGEKLLSIYSFLDRDLLLAGIILHDLDKTEEMIVDEFGVEEYSLKGSLIGHIVTGVSNIERICKDLKINDELKIILEHLILSHHHKSEYGSPIPPLVPEGELIHFIDMIDSRMNNIESIYENIKPGEFSEKIFALEGRRFYKATWKK